MTVAVHFQVEDSIHGLFVGCLTFLFPACRPFLAQGLASLNAASAEDA
jgi:hypothetical protein